MVDEEAVVEEEGRSRIGPKMSMLLGGGQAFKSDEECRKLFSEPVLSSIWTDVCDGLVDCVSKVNLALQGSIPCWRVGVFEIRHVDVSTGIESINHHLPVDRACDFDAPLAKVQWDRSNFPLGVSNFARLVEEIG